MISFASDNCSGIAPDIEAELLKINQGACASYGSDQLTDEMHMAFEMVFERPLHVFTVITGTAANSLALATLCAPYGAVLCHEQAHIMVDECAAPEFFSGGARLVGIAGDHGRINPQFLENYLQNYESTHTIHMAKPMVLSLTQSTEAGTVYTLEELRSLVKIAHRHHLKIHMDGARMANALTNLGCSPAEMTWKIGIDALSFGATKNGCWAAEAVLFFDSDYAQALHYRRKKSGHLVSKMRFISGQFKAYLFENRWLKLSSHANGCAQDLVKLFQRYPEIKFCHPVMANCVFVCMPQCWAETLRQQKIEFYTWHDGSYRFVTSFATTRYDLEYLAQALQKCVLLSQ